jgi:putative Mg2+ transporter-C (MgtC) family protein
MGDFSIPDDTLDMFLRLMAATFVGMALGLERNLQGKQTGIRTMGLVAYVAALATLATTHTAIVQGSPDALSRVIQGVQQGVLIGVGFLGSGVILRDLANRKVHNLTTAADVWATAAMGLACAVAPWALVGMGFCVLLMLVIGCRYLEKKFQLGDFDQ